MNFYKIKVQYNGFHYIGWQVQPEGKTIQGTLEQALKKISKNDEVKTIGSGRTDSGVHALGQIVKVGMHLKIDGLALQKALNSNLPDSIRVLESEVCDESFHPIFNAVKKEYIYAFTLKKERNPFVGELVARYPYQDFDLDTLKMACRLFEGEKDFCNYFCTGTPIKSTVRTIHSCNVSNVKADSFFKNFNSDVYLVSFVGSGFLKQMVRLMMGALWAASSRKISLQDIENSLAVPLKNKLAPVAPPQGLYLKSVDY